MTVHLKDKTKVRIKKRWSQVIDVLWCYEWQLFKIRTTPHEFSLRYS